MFVYTLQTKLELESIKQQPQSQQQPAATTGSSLFKLSSKVKAFQSNINTKLQTAGIQINNLNRLSTEETLDLNDFDDPNNAVINGNGHDDAPPDALTDGHQSKTVDKETRRLRDDIESLQTQMANLKEMLKQSMEEKDQLQKGVAAHCLSLENE